MKIETLSASSYNCYKTCPYQWKLNYKLKLIQPKSDAFIIGIAFHKCLELYHQDKLKDEILETIKKEILQEMNDINIKNFSIIRMLFEKYCKSPIEAKTLNTEWKFEIPLKIGEDELKLIGVIDRVIDNGIVEYKTSANDYTLKDTEGIQKEFYIYAFFKNYKKYPSRVIYCVGNKNKVSKPDYEIQKIEIDDTYLNLKEFEKKCIEVYNNVLEEKFSPNKGNHCNWCFFKEYCKYK